MADMMSLDDPPPADEGMSPDDLPVAELVEGSTEEVLLAEASLASAARSLRARAPVDYKEPAEVRSMPSPHPLPHMAILPSLSSGMPPSQPRSEGVQPPGETWHEAACVPRSRHGRRSGPRMVSPGGPPSGCAATRRLMCSGRARRRSRSASAPTRSRRRRPSCCRRATAPQSMPWCDLLLAAMLYAGKVGARPCRGLV